MVSMIWLGIGCTGGQYSRKAKSISIWDPLGDYIMCLRMRKPLHSPHPYWLHFPGSLLSPLSFNILLYLYIYLWICGYINKLIDWLIDFFFFGKWNELNWIRLLPQGRWLQWCTWESYCQTQLQVSAFLVGREKMRVVKRVFWKRVPQRIFPNSSSQPLLSMILSPC